MANIKSNINTPLYLVIHEMIADMRQICREQKKPTTWRQKFCYAVPYLEALGNLDSVNENYGWDNGRTLVNYLLANLNTYKGEKAKEFKSLLKEMVKVQ